jgi:hypothetical protein
MKKNMNVPNTPRRIAKEENVFTGIDCSTIKKRDSDENFIFE